MRREFVKTENSKRFRAHVALQENRGSQESGWIVVHGRPGEGKTSTLHNWAAERGAVMLTAQVDWTVRRMMVDLAEKLGIEHTTGFEKKIEEIIGTEELPIVVDEGGFAFANAAACLERLRGITDKTCTLMVLILMEQDVPKLARRTQISSRARICQFNRSTHADVAAACAQLSEVEIAPAVVARIHDEADASMRLVMSAIHLVEAVARKLGKQRIELEDVRQIQLCDDFTRAMRESRKRRIRSAGGV
ncbi:MULTISPECIES: hypothetical protein [unclassified Variovorax]|uniref:hypothetical protein n=1 Tax=unclassified Variovorax TaxID=663243 RepID=UPI0032E74E37